MIQYSVADCGSSRAGRGLVDRPVVHQRLQWEAGCLPKRLIRVIGVLCEDVVEGHGLQVAALDDVDQLGVAVGDGGQVGVDEHDLLRLK